MAAPAQHPGAQLCADYRVGDITPGAALAVAVHLAACPTCCLTVQEPARRADQRWAPLQESGSPAAAAALPPPLRDTPRGRWSRIASGTSAARFEGVSGLGQSVQLVRAAPGARFPLPPSLDILVGLGGSISGDWGELAAGGLVEQRQPGVASADPTTGFLGLAVGSDRLYQGFLSRLFSRY